MITVRDLLKGLWLTFRCVCDLLGYTLSFLTALLRPKGGMGSEKAPG